MVDKDVTSPHKSDFYLQSHPGLKGSEYLKSFDTNGSFTDCLIASRPSHYIVLYNKLGFSIDMWVNRNRADLRHFLTYCEECNKLVTSYATRMPGARDLYPFLHRSIVSFVTNDLRTTLNSIHSPRRRCESCPCPSINILALIMSCQIVCSRAGFYLDENLGYSDFGSGGSGFDLSVWRKGFNAPGPQSMYFI